MAAKLLFLNSLMERRKPKDRTDELAVVKAAAWAWYQHGSGSGQGKATSEFDVARTRRAPCRPSRYKLEAMKMSEEAKEESPVDHTKKSLLDAYEVQSISRHLDSLIGSSHNKLGNGDNPADAGLDYGGRRMKKKKIRKGFWLRRGVVCGTGEDVVDPSALRHDRLSAKRVPVVNLAKCLPRADGAL